MIAHHPDINLLAEYSSGALDWGLSLAVSAHLDFCSECQNRVHNLNRFGGGLLSSAPTVTLDDTVFAKVMASIEQGDAPQISAAPKVSQTKTQYADPMLKKLPKVVQKLIPDQGVKWRFVSPALRMARLRTGQDKYEVAFHRIGVGGQVAEHGHKGVEVTVVLNGCFSDADGVYREGDFLVRQPGEVHRPTAAQNQDCLCFSVSEAPVHLTGFLGKIINPFLSIRPH